MGSVMLERLTIDGCQMMDAIFWKERGEDEAAATAIAKIHFPHLKYFIKEEVVRPHNLQVVDVQLCGSVEVIFDLQQSNVNGGSQELAMLTRLDKTFSQEATKVIARAGRGIFNLFPPLTRLSLKKLPKLLQITPKAYTFNWPSLKDLTLVDCGRLTETLYDTLKLQALAMEDEEYDGENDEGDDDFVS
ncbi:hypothetical protein LguiA_002613 [Lonicera macranthoides]